MENASDFKKAIQTAELERDGLVEQLRGYDRIRSRINQLEVFIKTGKELLGDEREIAAIPQVRLFAEPEVTEETNKGTHLDSIVAIMKETGRSLSLAEIADEFYKRSWRLSEKNGMEVIRGVIKRNASLFTREERKEHKIYRAYYGLRAAPVGETAVA